jgi:Protein of unknown function (DUF2752)
VTTRRLAAAGIGMALVLPRGRLDDLPILCPFRRMTGLPCPTCGLTRSWNAMAHFRPSAAFAEHPFGPLSFCAALLVALRGPHVVDRPELRDRRVVAALAALWLYAWLRRLRA